MLLILHILASHDRTRSWAELGVTEGIEDYEAVGKFLVLSSLTSSLLF